MVITAELHKQFPRTDDYYGIHAKWPGTIVDNEYVLKMYAGGHKFGWSLIFENQTCLTVDTCHSVKGLGCTFRLETGRLLNDWGITLTDVTIDTNKPIVLNLDNKSQMMYEMGRVKPFWLFSIIITPTPQKIYYMSQQNVSIILDIALFR